MSPQILSSQGDGRGVNRNEPIRDIIHVPEANRVNSNDEAFSTASTRLQTAPNDEIHDLVCIGFGPASLSIAVALHDFLHSPSVEKSTKSALKIRFLERQTSFGWHAGMLLPGAKMQISFIKDLATLRDPCSTFTFLNYLRVHDRLVQFANLGTFLPSRLEFEDYMRWAAGQFASVVAYGEEVDCIRSGRRGKDGKVEYFQVRARNAATGQTTTCLTKNVVIAVGGRPALPTEFSFPHAQILHSSQYSTRIDQALPKKDGRYTIAVVGSGQSAAEVFTDLHVRYPNAATRLIFRDTTLRPSDDSPFVNEIFNPEAVDSFYSQSKDLRLQSLKMNKDTNYSVVRLQLLEKIYEEQYLQSIREPHQRLWQHQILSSREIVEVSESTDTKQIRLALRNAANPRDARIEIVNADAVVLATGYHRDAHMEILRDCEGLRASGNNRWRVRRNYSVELDRSLVAEDVGIWLQGCNEETHGLSDSLLSILATRSGELVQSIFGQTSQNTRGS